MTRSHRLPLALTLAIAFAAGCGPVKIDVGGVVVAASPRGLKSPGEVGSPSPDGTPTPQGTVRPNQTPTPQGTFQPNQTPTPPDQVGGSPSPTPLGASPTPTPVATATAAPAGNASIKSFALDGPNKPVGVGVDSQGNAWVGMGLLGATSSDPGTAIKLGPDGSKLKTVDLPGTALAVVVDKQDNAWVLHMSKSQFGGGQAGAISKISATGELLSTQVLGGLVVQPSTLVLDPQGNLWTLEQQGKLDKISSNGGLLGSYPTGGTSGSQAYAVGVDALGSSWVGVQLADKNLIHLNASGVVQDSFKVSASGVYTVAVDSAGGIWAAGPSPTGGAGVTTAVQYLDAAGKVLQTFQIGAYPRQFLPAADQKMWVLTATQAGGGSVTKMTSKGDSLDSYPAGDAPQAFGVGGDGSIWVANPMSGKVTRIKPAT
jgi:streptogramin lyase